MVKTNPVYRSGIIRYAWLCLLFILGFSVRLQAQGLLFQGNNKLISERTSYNVFQHSMPVFNNRFTLSFDLSILDTTSFGYVCFIKDNESEASFSLTLSEKDHYVYLDFNIDSKQNLVQIPLKKSELGYRRWHRVTLNFLSDKNAIEIIVDGKSYTSFFKQYKKQFSPVIIFGKHDNVVDVPKIAIRQLVIRGEKKAFSFLFDEHDGNAVHDTKGSALGHVDNPVWLINESYHWKLRYTGSSKTVAAINFDNQQQRIIIANKDSVVFFDCKSNTTETARYANPLDVPMRLGMSFIDTTSNSLFIYEVNDLPLFKSSIASLNLTRLTWVNKSQLQLPQQRHHHIGFYDAVKQNYLIFGGFGNRRFAGDFMQYNIPGNTWTIIPYTGDRITPRFFLGQVVESPHNTIVFGGIGNNTGDQSLGKSYYFDCYRVNHQTRSIKKLWNISIGGQGMVTVRNMFLADDKKSFYTICYPEYIPNTFLKLYKFNLSNGNYEILGDSIPMNSERIETNANLYFNSITKELYCTTQEFQPDGSSIIKVYSISDPPVSSDIFVKTKNAGIKYRVLYALGGLSGLGLFIYFLVLQKRRKKTRSALHIEEPAVTTEVVANTPVKNAIFLFGEYKALDKNGRDITHLFSPKIRQLYLFILLNYIKNGEGVSSAQIYSNIWPEKPVDKAKNSKGVILNQLREILTDIEGIDLITNKGSVSLSISNLFYCDFKEYKQLMGALLLDTENYSILQRLIVILKRGAFLKSLDFECFDTLKKEFEDEILTIFPPLLESGFKNGKYSEVVQMANILNCIDKLNEKVLHFEIVSYIKLNKMDQAKKRYNNYLIAFKHENGESIPKSFQEIISKKTSDLR